MSSIAKNYIVTNQKPRNSSVLTNKPKVSTATGETKIYTETRTISKGQPIPWGFNWLMTYPVALTNFTATRI